MLSANPGAGVGPQTVRRKGLERVAGTGEEVGAGRSAARWGIGCLSL